MSYQRPKICLLFAGGTRLIGKGKTPVEVHHEREIPAWLAEVPEVQIIARLDPLFIQSETLSTTLPQTWSILARQIKRRYAQYDGFIVLQPIDVLAYTGAALSFMLQHLGKPVVITGSQQTSTQVWSVPPAEELTDFRRLGLRANLINAVQVATMDLAEVAVMFGNRLLRGGHAHNFRIEPADTDESLEGEIGKIDFGIKLHEQREHRRRTGIVVYPEVERNLAVLRLHPGVDPLALLQEARQGTRGYFLKTGSIGLTRSQADALEQYAKQRNAPIMLYRGAGQEAPEYPHLIGLPDMSEETSIVKSMWALGQTKNLTRLRELLSANIAGEFSVEQETGA